ncbi:MAG: MFS transporter [Desulfobacterales bacterium]|nr:MFS transporter [Desulfobacterales bacterium]
MPKHKAIPRSRIRSEEGLSRILGPVLLLTVIFFFHFVARQVAGPLLPAMEAELGLSHFQGGLFILCMGTGFFISQIGAAYLAGWWGYRRCILVSLWGAAASAAAVGFLGSAWALYLGFLCLGITGGLYVPAGISLITVLVRPRDWGKAMGIHEVAPNMALITVPFLATAVVAAVSWRLGYLLAAAVLALFGAAYLFFGVDSEKRPSPPDLQRIREIAANPSFWSLGLLLSLAVGVETGVYSMVPLFLVSERGFDLADANQLLGLSRIPGLVMVLLAGWITDRLSPSTTITLALALTGTAVVALGVGPAGWIAPAVFVQAAASACLFPPILSLASRISTTENRALTLSLSLAVAPVIGGGLLPAGIALAGDLGSFAAGLVGAGLLTAAGIGLVSPLKR